MQSTYTPPRHFLDNAGLPGAGLPHDRLAQLAARRAFVELKHTFLRTVAPLQGPRAAWLQHQVRLAEEPVDLWLLRAAVFAELPQGGEGRAELERGIERLFPDSAMPSLPVSVF
jgi:hypothetical protein